jgi:hypothetical protein
MTPPIIEDISSFDDWIAKRVKKNGSMCATFRTMRKKLQWIGDVIIINYICRRYREEGAKVDSGRLYRMLIESEEYRKMNGREKGVIRRDALSRLGVSEGYK